MDIRSLLEAKAKRAPSSVAARHQRSQYPQRQRGIQTYSHARVCNSSASTIHRFPLRKGRTPRDLDVRLNLQKSPQICIPFIIRARRWNASISALIPIPAQDSDSDSDDKKCQKGERRAREVRRVRRMRGARGRRGRREYSDLRRRWWQQRRQSPA